MPLPLTPLLLLLLLLVGMGATIPAELDGDVDWAAVDAPGVVRLLLSR